MCYAHSVHVFVCGPACDICMYTYTTNILYSEAAVESDLMYMLQPSRIYIGDNVNTFCHGKTFTCACI